MKKKEINIGIKIDKEMNKDLDNAIEANNSNFENDRVTKSSIVRRAFVSFIKRCK